MKHALFGTLAVCLLAVALPAKAQTAADLNEGFLLVKDFQTEVFTLSWWGKTGRTYFIQTSDDLMIWTYLPYVETGVAGVDGINFTNTETRQFWRLRYTDAPTGGNAQTADFDGDGVSNQEELDEGLDPFSADSDGDGVGDADEIDFSLNKAGNDMTLMASGLQYNTVNRLEQRTESGVTQAVGYDQEGNITGVQ